jgi:hypothetical protein
MKSLIDKINESSEEFDSKELEMGIKIKQSIPTYTNSTSKLETLP